MYLLEKEMSVRLNSLSRAMQNISSKCDDSEVKSFFAGLSELLDGSDTFEHAWEIALKNSRLLLDEELKENLAGMGRGIGYMDLENNANMIKLVLDELDDCISKENAGISDRIKVYRTISITAGIYLAIIFA